MEAAVVGSIGIDMIVTVERISLRGEMLRGEDIRYIPGGEGANQTVAMAKLGANVEMFGCVGNGEVGRSLTKSMEDMRVGIAYIKVTPGVNTDLAVTTVGSHDNMVVVVAGTSDRVNRKYVDNIRDALLACGTVLLQHEIPQGTIEYVTDIRHENGVKVVLSPGPARPVRSEVLVEVDYLIPDEHEAAILFRNMPVEEMLKTYPGKLVITQGSRGVSTCLPTGGTLTVPAKKANVVDTMGAGDTLSGTFIVRVAEGSTMEKALRFANTATSLSTKWSGAQGEVPVRNQVLEATHQEKM